MKIPVMIQMQNSENGATALCMILGYYKRFVPIEEMREICISSRNGSSPSQLAEAAGYYGLNASIETISADQLKECKFPVMIRWKRRYYALIKSIRGNIATIIDPASGYPAWTYADIMNSNSVPPEFRSNPIPIPEHIPVSVTIISDSGFLSDALSTACFILGPDLGIPLAEKYSSEAIFIMNDGTVLTSHGIIFEESEAVIRIET